MNQTPNYQLNQWEATDQVLREDFNADNAKIDGALSAMMKFEPIKTVVLEANAGTMVVDVSDIDWAQWRYVILEMKLKTGGGEMVYVSTGGNDYFLYVGNLNPQNDGIASLQSSYNDQMVLFPLRTPDRPVLCLTFRDRLVMGYTSTSYRRLSTLRLKCASSGGMFQAGSEVTIFGIR